MPKKPESALWNITQECTTCIPYGTFRSLLSVVNPNFVVYVPVVVTVPHVPGNKGQYQQTLQMQIAIIIGMHAHENSSSQFVYLSVSLLPFYCLHA